MILLYDTGARVQEILDLKLRDICFDSKSPFVTVTGKGNKMRSIPVMKKTCEHIKVYLKIYHPSKQPDDYLFYIDRKGKRSQMSADNVGKFITKDGKKARIVSKDVPEH